MTPKQADAYYHVSQATIVGLYYYGNATLDKAYRDFRAIEQEKSIVPLLEETIEANFKRMYSEIDSQRKLIEGEL